MTQPAKAQEPSMEEILASIRRIIADDDASKSAPKPVEAAKPAVEAPPVQHQPDPPARPQLVEPSVPEPVMAAKPEPLPEAPSYQQPAEQAADILDLTESMASAPAAPAPNPPFQTIDGSMDVGYGEPAPQSVPQRPVTEPVSALLSTATVAAVDSAFNTLAQTVLVQNARTLEDLVREMLRPMLKSWLDDNLPGVVERLVRAEIERVSRGRAG